MRLILTFNAERELLLPLSYHEILQGFIYKNLEKGLAERIHQCGFPFEKRHFKLFTFSRLMGKARVNKGQISFSPPFKLVISSPLKDLLQSLAENLLKSQEVRLGDNKLFLESISVNFAPKMKEAVSIRMLSPVTVYSTLITPEGRKKTYYYNPKEKEFAELIRQNIIKKYKAFYGRPPSSQDFDIEPLRVRREDEKLITYKGFIIKGWMGRYRLCGAQELLQFAYEAGLGAKNSQGFGCFEVEE